MEREASNSQKSIRSIADILAFMTHDSLTPYKKKGTSAPLKNVVRFRDAEKNKPYKSGVVFVSSSKEDLTQGKGFIVTSYETLEEKYRGLSHWTPNTFRGGTYYDFKNRIIKGHERENLKQINVIGMDIDSKDVDLYGLYIGCEELGLPRPNLLLSTPRGYQVFYVLSTPFYIHKKQDYKSLRIAERLSSNIRKALKQYAPVDANCVPFGFYRMPTEENVLDFFPTPADTRNLISWSVTYEKKNMFRVIYSTRNQTEDMTRSDWYQALIRSERIDSGYHGSSRNNALMTLALANYQSGRCVEEAYDELDQFNSNLTRPLSKQEFERTLKSAYSGKYKGVKRSYVESLLELWTDGQARFIGREGWYKFKKPREERSRSHYDERESDILEYLKKHTTEVNPFLKGSLSMLAETFGMALSTLKEVLKQSKRIVKQTKGRGRNAVTRISAKSVLFKHLITLKQITIPRAQLVFPNVLPKEDTSIIESEEAYRTSLPFFIKGSPPRARSS
ncbi:primase C-terminal domain-containing protein [Fictibacillus barbaricus]|uniref:Primase C-terminal domain-containing protein n=1 Tax=Fictibacillus barbaricus TaxID=182136 RepID=A0ABS2Z7R3_9BACL|nr:primase C-terminal domain-containing protein [Fictibacillus barbaricus]MBN3544098.1 primase C-terminal domain-containing protein [Fictibacillus barbaricus]GGB68908.1 replication protein [Fictibacillus barbaricus]